MPINYPTSLDAFTDPTGANTLLSADHVTMHQNIHAALEALEAKVGVDDSAVQTSLDAKSRYLFDFTVPVAGDFAWHQQGLSTYDDSRGSIYLALAAGGGGGIVRGLVDSVPATPYTIIAAVMPLSSYVAGSSCGIGLRDSSTGRWHLARLRADGAGSIDLRVEKFTEPSTFAASPYTNNFGSTSLSVGKHFDARPYWLKIEDTGTSLITYISVDGIHWISVHSVSRTDHMTGGPTHMGFYNVSNLSGSEQQAAMRLLSWGVS